MHRSPPGKWMPESDRKLCRVFEEEIRKTQGVSGVTRHIFLLGIAAQIVRGQLFDPSTLRAHFHGVPDDVLRHAAAPQYAILPDGSKQPTFPNAGSAAPTVDCDLDPVGHRHCAHMAGFTYQVDNRPVSVSPLNLADFQVGHLGSSKAATEQEAQHRRVSFAGKCVGAHRGQKLLTLLGCEPVTDLLSELFHAFDAADSGHQLRAEQATVRCLVGQPPDRRQAEVYRCRSKSPM